MTAEDGARWIDIERSLDALLELEPAARGAWLDTHCTEPTLRARIEALLEADARSDGAVDRIRLALVPDSARTMIGREIGPYRLLAPLGEGGSATVFLAERERDGSGQRVALKLLRHGVYADEERRRFQREQQILARLEHPAIARFIGGGFTPEQVPWFAMELVAGEPITRWCEGRGASLRRRLELFAAICDGVAYAHQHLVVHRDLKPSNILIGVDARPRVLDFGIAKLLDDEDRDATSTQQRKLTPRYAAPEQFRGDPASTATDVFSLGVLLHELLTALPPQFAVDGYARAPSAVHAAALAARQGTSTALRPRCLRGDLDTIVLKALQSEPARRYANAGTLADDVRRHLDGLPIAARRDSATYRTAKFLRRHAWAAGFAALALLALAAGAGAAWSQAQRATVQAHRADAAAAAARAEAERARALQLFMLGLLQSAAPGSVERNVESVDDLLTRGRERAASAFAGDPALHAQALAEIGDVLRQRGRLDAAKPALEQALALSEASFGRNDRRTLAMQSRLARWTHATGHYAEGIAALEPRIAAYRAAGQPEGVELAEALIFLGALKRNVGEHAVSVDLTRSAWEIFRRLPQAKPADLNDAMASYGEALSGAGRNEEAADVLRQVLAREREQFGLEHNRVTGALHALAIPLRQLGRLDEAEQLLREALAIDRALHSEPHASTAADLNDLGAVLVNQNRLAEAEELFTQAYAIQKTVYAPDHTAIASTRNNLAVIRHMQGRYADAEPLFREALAAEIAARGENSSRAAQDRRNLARALVRLGRLDEAQSLFERALDADRHNFPAPHKSQADDLMGLANIARERGRFARAIDLARQSLALLAQLSPKPLGSTGDAHLVLARSLLAQRDATSARTEFELCLADLRAMDHPPPTAQAQALRGLAQAQLALGDPAAAAESARLALAVPGLTNLTPAEREALDRMLRAPRVRERSPKDSSVPAPARRGRR